MDAEDLVNHVLLAIGDGALMEGFKFADPSGKRWFRTNKDSHTSEFSE